MICPDHQRELKGPNKRGYLWHVINYENGEFCNKLPSEVAEEPATDPTESNGYARAKQVTETIKAGEQATIKREKLEEPDWNAINRGKVRCQVAVAFIRSRSREVAFDVDEMEKWVDYIMDGPSETN